MNNNNNNNGNISNNDKRKLVCTKAGLALFMLTIGVSMTACSTGNNNNVDTEQGVTTHEQEKLNQLEDVTTPTEEETDKSGEDVKEDLPQYDGNRYENQFLGLRLRYPENWFTDDSYDVIMNVMKELGVNDKLDLRNVKVPRALNIVAFDSNDNYNNMIDIVSIPALDKIAVAENETNNTTTTSKEVKKEDSKDTNKDKATDKEQKPENSDKSTVEKVIPKFTPEDFAKIKKGVELSMGVENLISYEEPYTIEVTNNTLGKVEIAVVEFVTKLYGQEWSMATGYINLGENYLMITSVSINEPNDVDKIYNIEDIVSTLEIGFDVSNDTKSKDSEEPVLAPVQKQSDDEVLNELENATNEELDNLDTKANDTNSNNN